MELLLAAFLGLGVAASTGLNTSLPLLLLGAAARFHVAGITLNPKFAWLHGNTALIVLIIAAIVEIVGDKFPSVDHVLDVAGTFVRPAAGALAAASVFTGADPMVAAVAGLIIGAPISLGLHTVKAGARITSSVTTLGCANPILSLVEDGLAVAMSVLAIFVPLLVPLAVALVVAGLWRLSRALKQWRSSPAAS